AEPENYAAVSVPDNDVVFTAFGGNNYPQLAQQRLGDQKGRAFITEYAGAATRFSISDPALRALLSQYPYLTRVYTRISPEDMTIDPVFRFNASLPDVSNVHDLSKDRSEEHTSELQSLAYLVCRLLLEKKNSILYSERTLQPPDVLSDPPM